MSEEKSTALFTPEEAGTVRNIKERVIRNPQLNRLPQEIITIFATIRSKVADNHSRSLIFSNKGFSHRVDSNDPQKGNPAGEVKECLRLLQYFHQKLSAIAKAYLL